MPAGADMSSSSFGVASGIRGASLDVTGRPAVPSPRRRARQLLLPSHDVRRARRHRDGSIASVAPRRLLGAHAGTRSGIARHRERHGGGFGGGGFGGDMHGG